MIMLWNLKLRGCYSLIVREMSVMWNLISVFTRVKQLICNSCSISLSIRFCLFLSGHLLPITKHQKLLRQNHKTIRDAHSEISSCSIFHQQFSEIAFPFHISLIILLRYIHIAVSFVSFGNLQFYINCAQPQREKRNFPE